MMVHQQNTESSVSPLSANVQLISTRRHFTIKRDQENGFGFNVVGGTDNPYIPGYTGIFISRIRRQDLDGINEGDQIISVNDIALEGKTHQEAVNILREAVDNSTFLIETNAEQRIASRFDYSPEAVHHSSPSLATCVVSDDQSSIAQTSVPSSNVSNVSGYSGHRAKNSSTSTINQSVLHEDGTIIRQQWAIEEDETTIERSRSPSLSRTIRDRLQNSGPSLFMELLFVSLGVIAIGTAIYFGYKRFSRGGSKI